MQDECRLPQGECFSVNASRYKFKNMWYHNKDYWNEYLTFWAGGAGKSKDFQDDVIYCTMMWVTQNEVQNCLSKKMPVTKKRVNLLMISMIIILCIIFLLLCGGYFWFHQGSSSSDGRDSDFFERINFFSIRERDESYELHEYWTC